VPTLVPPLDAEPAGLKGVAVLSDLLAFVPSPRDTEALEVRRRS